MNREAKLVAVKERVKMRIFMDSSDYDMTLMVAETESRMKMWKFRGWAEAPGERACLKASHGDAIRRPELP